MVWKGTYCFSDFLSSVTRSDEHGNMEMKIKSDGCSMEICNPQEKREKMEDKNYDNIKQCLIDNEIYKKVKDYNKNKKRFRKFYTVVKKGATLRY